MRFNVSLGFFLLILLHLTTESECKVKKLKLVKKLVKAKIILKPLIKSGALKAPMLHFVVPLLQKRQQEALMRELNNMHQPQSQNQILSRPDIVPGSILPLMQNNMANFEKLYSRLWKGLGNRYRGFQQMINCYTKQQQSGRPILPGQRINCIPNSCLVPPCHSEQPHHHQMPEIMMIMPDDASEMDFGSEEVSPKYQQQSHHPHHRESPQSAPSANSYGTLQTTNWKPVQGMVIPGTKQ